MSFIFSGWFSHVTAVSKLMIRNSPLGMFLLLVIHSPSNITVQWLTNDLLFRVPFTILAGCRLILSVREATSMLQSDQSVSNFPSTVVFGDRSNLSHA